jgi:rod shape determining protein RodA
MGFNQILEQHQRNRINVLLGKIHDPRGLEWNVENSKMAIGSGGWTGKGYRDGTVTATNYVPVQSTDFIFCTVGEEWGFIGSSVMVLLFLALILRIFFIAERQRSVFTRIYAYCTGCVFFVHFIINTGMTVGLVPVIGIPLPFISYGGSSLLSFTILLFILIKLDSNRLMVLR